MSDWNDNLKPIASKLHADLLKTHGQETTGALVEALEIARRQAEIEQTIAEWRERHQSTAVPSPAILLAEATRIFKSLAAEFGAQRAVHLLTAIERQHTRARWAADLRAWRARMKVSVADAAADLGLAEEDVLAIESGQLNAGPAAMRLIRPALHRVRRENGGVFNS